MKADKSPKAVELAVNIQAEAKDLLFAAFPPRIEHNRKSWFHYVARELRWTPRRVRALFHLEAKVVRAEELRELQRRYEIQQQRAAQRERDRNALQVLQDSQQRVSVAERATAGAARRESVGGEPMGPQQGLLPFDE